MPRELRFTRLKRFNFTRRRRRSPPQPGERDELACKAEDQIQADPDLHPAANCAIYFRRREARARPRHGRVHRNSLGRVASTHSENFAANDVTGVGTVCGMRNTGLEARATGPTVRHPRTNERAKRLENPQEEGVIDIGVVQPRPPQPDWCRSLSRFPVEFG
jgi:hypothetical protein